MNQNNKRETINEDKDKLTKQIQEVDDIIFKSKELIHKESTLIECLKDIKNKQVFIRNMYNDTPEDALDSMTTHEFSTYKMPLHHAIQSGSVINEIDQDITANLKGSSNLVNLCATVYTMASTAANTFTSLPWVTGEWFPNKERIIEEFRIEDDLYNQIQFIRNELTKLSSDIAADFDSFIAKYNSAQKDESKYMDLIGSRSLFFFKVIFDFSMQNYGTENPRKLAIENFVYGSAPRLKSADTIMDQCKKLYEKMSSQDGSGKSIKKGKADIQYIEALFRELISTMKLILDMRRIYFKP